MINKIIKKATSLLGNSIPKKEIELLAIGQMLSNQQYSMESININDFEFKIFSQFGDDGIIQHLIKNIAIDRVNPFFMESFCS